MSSQYHAHPDRLLVWRYLEPVKRAMRQNQLFQAGGSQLLEFALVLPFLVVLFIAIVDFAGAFNLKQNMANAAREGARVAASNPSTDADCSNPTACTIQAAADAVKQYLNQAITPSSQNYASCIDPTAMTQSGTTWTVSCNGITLSINRAFVFTSGAVSVEATQVTLSCPFTWNLTKVIGLLIRGATLSLPTTLTETAVMQNLVS